MDDGTLARFESKTAVSENGCWLWTASTRGGYGLFWLDGRTQQAHRLSYEHHVGPIPDVLVLDHLCRDRTCVNPAHLEPVTSVENIARGEAGINHRSKTHCPKNHAYDDANTYVDKLGRRSCRTCNRSAARSVAQRRRITT